ncbi:MAG TPA: hypothetical protein VLN59_18400, partial [Burkholderiales bacterium]|nr:hypothetical protein [Burkholderiales bacterium]
MRVTIARDVRLSLSALTGAAMLASVLSYAAPTSVATEGYPTDWAVDPATPGDNVPSAGRSLFDFVVVRNDGNRKVYDVPFPFSALIERVERHLQADGSGSLPLKRVLIPLGRSLQRASAAPEFFKYPRVVMVPDAEPHPSGNDAGMLMKDRLYLGYQEKANIIEVISYNEAAGRFEFQLVKDYRAGGKPRVFYANRAICTACHQNAAPLFSRQVWDETNANPRIAALLREQRRDFYGIDSDRGVDVPYAIDNATDRANLYSAYQLLWRAGCGSAIDREAALRCRASLYTAALQYCLSGRQRFDATSRTFREHVVATFTRSAHERWPRGLKITNPDIPNRDPF